MATKGKRESTIHHRPEVDANRRRFARSGLVAPVVVGTLLSRPVLGAPYNCTVSGQISGNLSNHKQGVCSTLGRSPDSYLLSRSNSWPEATRQIASCYYRRNVVMDGHISEARVADVLRGDTQRGDGNSGNSNLQLDVKSGFDQRHGIALGREAVAAYLNAIGPGGYPTFPVSGTQVLEMFDAVIRPGGIYRAGGADWDIVDVTNYFRSLHP